MPLRVIAHDGTVYAVLFDDASVVAVDQSSGERRWRREIQNLERGPLAAGAYLYVTEQPLGEARRLLGLDFETGETVTKINSSGEAHLGPSDDLYLGSVRASPDGENQWQANLDETLAVDSEYVYARETFDSPRTLKAVNPDNGSISWEFELPSNYDHVAAGTDHVYVAIRGSNRVFAISKADGTRAGLYSVPEPRTLAVGDGMLAVVSGFSGQYSDRITRTGVRILRDG